METQSIIILLIVLVVIFYVYKKYFETETFMPMRDETKYLKDFNKYYHVGPVYQFSRKKPYTNCGYGAKNGEKVDISECIYNKKELKDEVEKIVKDTIKKEENVERFKSITDSKPTPASPEENAKLSDTEYQFGYYKIFNDLEEVNKNQYNQLNLPIGNYNTKTINLEGDAIGCKNYIGSPNTYYLKYIPPKFTSLNSIGNVQASNIIDYDTIARPVYENDDLTKGIIDKPAASNEVIEMKEEVKE